MCIRDRHRDPQTQHGQRGGAGQLAADVDDPVGIGEVPPQVLQVLDLGVDGRLQLVGPVLLAGPAGEAAQRDRLELLAQRRVAAEADGGGEARDGGLADPDPVGELGDRQERGLGDVLDQVLGDAPLPRRQTRAVEEFPEPGGRGGLGRGHRPARRDR